MKKDLLTLLLLITTIFSADFPHFGMITDAANQPLAQVKVVSKATGKIAVTDSDGHFGDWPEAVLKTAIQDITEPTLFNNRLYLSANRAGEPISATLLNVRGQTLWHFEGVTDNVGVNTIPVDYSTATGMYLIRLTVGEREWCRKITSHQKPALVSRIASDPANSAPQGRFLPFDDTLIVSAKGYVRTTRLVSGGDNSQISIAMGETDAQPEVSFAVDTLHVTVNMPKEIEVTATDVTGDIINFYWKMSGMIGIDSTVTASYNCTVTGVGERYLYCSVVNEHGIVSPADSLLLIATNASLTLNAPDSISIMEDTPRTLTVDEMSIVNSGSNTNYSLIVLEGENYTVDGATITPVVNFNGALEVSVQVTNGEVTSNVDTINVMVTAVGDAPVITEQQTISVNEDVALTLTAEMFTITSADGETEFTLSVENGTNYTILNTTITPVANYNGELSVPVTVTGGNGLTSAVFNAVVTVAPVNDAPVISPIADGIVGLGNSFVSTPLVLSDVDGDALEVLVSDGAIYNNDTKKISYTSKLSTDNVGDNKMLIVAVTDGIDTVKTTLTLQILKHQWTAITTSLTDSIIDLAATEGHMYALCASNGTTQSLYDLSETGATLQSLEIGNTAERTSARAIQSVNEKLYLCKAGYNPNGPAPLWGFLLTPESFDFSDTVKRGSDKIAFYENNENDYAAAGVGSIWNGGALITKYTLYDSYKDTANNSFTPDGFSSFGDVVAARSGVNAFVLQKNGGVYQKLSAGGSWYLRESATKFKKVTLISDNGAQLVAIDENGTLYKKSSLSTVFGDLSVVNGAPTNLSTIVSLDEHTLWALDEFGALYFSAQGFESSKYITENVESKIITQVVFSDNKKDLYVVTEDNKIYKY